MAWSARKMDLKTYFRASAYAMIVVAMMALVLAGGLHLGLAITFVIVLVIAWRLEGTRWQLSERTGLFIVLASIPLFFLDWQYQKSFFEGGERLGVNALAHLIVFLSAVKLLQVKSDRDWIFLFLITFFEVLLAAGLSFSPVFLVTLGLYLLCGISTVIAFEITKAQRGVPLAETRLLIPPDAKAFLSRRKRQGHTVTEARRLPTVAIVLLLTIFVLALPLFLIAPRAGSAAFTRGGTSLTNFVGFSENVTLGEIGTLKTNNEVVMRVRLEAPKDASDNVHRRDLRWRGVALDEYTGRGWKKSSEAGTHFEQRTADRGFFQLGTTPSLHRLTAQTVFLEPIESPVLFALPRAVAIQGDFPFVRIDSEGTIKSRRQPLERTIYKVFSDTNEPAPRELRADSKPYLPSFERYLSLPDSIDPRFYDLARAMITDRQARTRYDMARAIESHLQQDYGYTLEMKASGPDPLADFLFNVKAGHCEYFSSAMVVLLRTQGIASRVVNGFLPGEYNDAADAFTIRQSDAHSWVEVYFPQTDSWITFDPTPSAGRTEPISSGIGARLGKYAEALELVWFQYVVGYDKQEQRSLATAMQSQASHYQVMLTDLLQRLRIISWRSFLTIGAFLILAFVVILLFSRVRRFGWRLRKTLADTDRQTSAIAFYERLLELLKQRGLERAPHMTPLEFARYLDLQPALAITAAYNRVRYGGEQLSAAEIKAVDWELSKLVANLQKEAE